MKIKAHEKLKSVNNNRLTTNLYTTFINNYLNQYSVYELSQSLILYNLSYLNINTF